MTDVISAKSGAYWIATAPRPSFQPLTGEPSVDVPSLEAAL
jgi:hypothetical protein